MSKHESINRLSVVDIKSMKGPGSIVSLTAYTTFMAQLMEDYVDLIIVGDSTAMVAYGYASTLQMKLEMMIEHGAAVIRGSSRPCVVIDLPFGTYQESKESAFRNAAKVLIDTGAQAVKLEGGLEMLDTVRFLVDRGIPVMPHIGLKPQHKLALGGYKVQGKSEEATLDLVLQAEQFADAGAFAVLVECVYEETAAAITKQLKIPTIGIGASSLCDGQVLVTEDVLGLFSGKSPKFAKSYVNLSEHIKVAFGQYEHDVRNRIFPADEHCYFKR